jgi:phosphoribosylanthranilate isomerase
MWPGVKCKICGMMHTTNINEVAALLPDYMGFIFYENSPRFVGHAFELPDNLAHTVRRVGVFVNHTMEYVLLMKMKYELDVIQLHGDESVDFCKELQSHQVEITKVFRVDNNFDFSQTIAYEDSVNYFLFDTKGKLFGGNAIPFDWNILESYNQKIPFFLSGGINESNINEISKFTSWNLHAIDLNSGVEDRPGVKNVKRITEILKHRKV